MVAFELTDDGRECVVGPGFNKYANDLSNMRNIARWIEYSISSTLMIVLISLINAVWDVVALMALLS